MKNVLLIGLGRFGRHMAQTLSDLHHQVLAIDKDEHNACLYTAIRISKEEGIAEGMAKGEAKGRAETKRKFAARDKKIAKFLRSIGVSQKNITSALAID